MSYNLDNSVTPVSMIKPSLTNPEKFEIRSFERMLTFFILQKPFFSLQGGLLSKLEKLFYPNPSIAVLIPTIFYQVSSLRSYK